MPQHSQSPRDLTRTLVAVLGVGALLLSTAWILRPFVSAFLWASTIVVATWPVMLGVEAKLGRRRGLATAVMTVAMLLVLIVPLGLSIGALVANMGDIVATANRLGESSLPPPPEWVQHIPIQGPKLADQWQRLSAQGPGAFSGQLAPYAGKFLNWCVARLGGMGAMIAQFLLTVVISGVLYMKGEKVASGFRMFLRRVAGPEGDRFAVLAAGTVRGVAIGVIVTAIIQAAVAWLGLLICSVPGVALLTAAALICCIAQIGPILVMLPAVIWKFYSGDSLWGFVLLAFTILAGTIDNFIRPILIRKGADLPLLLIIGGVIGGLISFGVMGIFVGPVLLAVTYVMLREWVEPAPESEQSERATA